MDPDEIEIVERTQIIVVSDMIGDGTPGSNPFRPRIFDDHVVGEHMSYVRGDSGVVVCQVEVDEDQADKYDSDPDYLVISKDVRGESVEKEKTITLTELRAIVTYLGVQGITADDIASKLGVRVEDIESELVGLSRGTIIRVIISIVDSQRALPELDAFPA